MNDRALTVPLSRPQNLKVALTSYLQLTKPSIMLLVLVTGATSLVLEGSMLRQPLRFALVLVGLYLTGGCANALNQYFERDIDARMSRTRYRRPLPLHRLSETQALVFAGTIGSTGVLLYGIVFNWLTALLSLATILFYSFVYTLWLKPNTWRNIVIGGAAGAMAPVGAWTAATGGTAPAPWLLFLIVFLWTPPHFWSLALGMKEDYERVGYPMLPVVKGDAAALNQILVYCLLVVVVSLSLYYTGAGWTYLVSAAFLGSLLLWKARVARKMRERKRIRGLFGYSIVYLFALCAAMVVDKLIRGL
jgi:protoheme IX farnesyltransferase